MIQYNASDCLLIADSGSTKTAWCMASPAGERILLHTRGINPAIQSETDISAILREDLLPRLHDEADFRQVSRIYFYGAGCLPSVRAGMQQLLESLLPGTKAEVESDLLGAARALCGHNAGIACILGTGSNSCLYDGRDIVQHVSPLGYILGDEGSGASLGKHFAGNLLKGLLASDLREAFARDFNLTESDIIRRVYREPGANRFLASLTVFMHQHRQHPDIHALTTECFKDFFRRNVDAYGRKDLPLRFTGSIAHYFSTELHEAAEQCGYRIDEIMQAPIGRITDYHLQNARENRAEEGFFGKKDAINAKTCSKA